MRMTAACRPCKSRKGVRQLTPEVARASLKDASFKVPMTWELWWTMRGEIMTAQSRIHIFKRRTAA